MIIVEPRMRDLDEAQQKLLFENPGNPVFIDYAESLRQIGKHSEALLVCLRGLNANPSAEKGFLLLARTYYEIGCSSFAVRELKGILERQPDNEAVRRLLQKLAPDLELKSSALPQGEELLAESEFAFDALEELGDTKS